MHQRVYDPRTEELVHLCQIERDVEDEALSFVGAFMENVVAKGIAVGDLCPMTKEAMVDIIPDSSLPIEVTSPVIFRQPPPCLLELRTNLVLHTRRIEAEHLNFCTFSK